LSLPTVLFERGCQPELGGEEWQTQASGVSILRLLIC